MTFRDIDLWSLALPYVAWIIWAFNVAVFAWLVLFVLRWIKRARRGR